MASDYLEEMKSENILSAEPVRVVRVFLASPSDLREERSAARAAIDEINRTVARPAGFQVDLIGWEDTLSVAQRPQAAINEDLSTCHMFIGMLWAKWGTPPDTTGRFTSGFEEEFYLAAERNGSSGEPYMSMYFKDVESSKLSDPGPELSKVINFKQKIIDEKKLLFDTFADVPSFAKKVRVGVSDFINKLRAFEQASSSQVSPKAESVELAEASEAVDKHSSESGQASFLAEIVSKISQEPKEILTNFEVARLRNIAASLQRSGNDEAALKVHDCNIIYKSGGFSDFANEEISGLVDAGLDAFNSENIPFWSWLKLVVGVSPLWLMYSTVFGPDHRRIGAFRALSLCRMPIKEDNLFRKSSIKGFWFSEETSDAVRSAALEFIGISGTPDMFAVVEEEFLRNNYYTRRVALDTIISLLGKVSSRGAAEYAISQSFEDISAQSILIVNSGLEELSTEQLIGGLEHRASAIKKKTLELLSARKSLRREDALRFFGDPSIATRRAAVDAIETIGGQLSFDELKQALIRDGEAKGVAGGFDFEGHAEFDKVRRERLSERAYDELIDSLQQEMVIYEDYYAAICIRHFIRIESQFEADFDDRFEASWKAYVERVRQKHGNVIMEMIVSHEGYRRGRLMRIAFDTIIKKSRRKDLERVRKAIDDDALEFYESDIDFLKKWGDWSDVRRVSKLAEKSRRGPGLGLLNYTAGGLKHASSAIIKLAEDRIGEVLSMDFYEALIASIVAGMSASAFRNLGRPAIDALIQRKEDKIRKASALQIIRSFNLRETRELMNSYIGKETYYYNVVFWLDLSLSSRRENSKDISNRELAKIDG